MEAALCCRRERLVQRSQKVHGEAKAGGDPADMDVGSRPLTMDGNWPGRSSEGIAIFSSRCLLAGVEFCCWL